MKGFCNLFLFSYKIMQEIFIKSVAHDCGNFDSLYQTLRDIEHKFRTYLSIPRLLPLLVWIGCIVIHTLLSSGRLKSNWWQIKLPSSKKKLPLLLVCVHSYKGTGVFYFPWKNWVCFQLLTFTLILFLVLSIKG